mmetsp:Transcript_6245/g.12356  ORF Transcript_6245/g.12356 Transcript_6245/m.12356 type:complete len:369 (-) Transcript_6245:1517-2623(-)|eukprot:CAMPEP_0184681584 /NCGR_PEP_ID=MMETSP0312-20130426/4563_1 /TAXON_ID=31354 /ORGANISM="Compsopogon coeruleus, Strain SAG 36.94" /LENGTH=368 /DNA_ID=CAMNT_0027132527 /DNA_START=3743 /DNA_END=4849 /DNA_ORIENTATION=+
MSQHRCHSKLPPVLPSKSSGKLMHHTGTRRPWSSHVPSMSQRRGQRTRNTRLLCYYQNCLPHWPSPDPKFSHLTVALTPTQVWNLAGALEYSTAENDSMMNFRNIVKSRFLSPYYTLHVVTFIAFVLLRRRVSPGELSTPDLFGFPKEINIYWSLFLICVARALSAPTWDAYLAHVFLFTRVAMMVVLWYMGVRYLMYFALVWTGIFILAPQPRVKDNDNIVPLNRSSFQDRIVRNPAKTIWIVHVFATWSPLCTQLAPLFSRIEERYRHVRVRCGSVDVTRWPEIAAELGIDTSGSSNDLPSYIAYVQGSESSRLPIKGSIRNVPGTLRIEDIETALELPKLLEQAKRWEKDAQDEYRRQMEAKKQS